MHAQPSPKSPESNQKWGSPSKVKFVQTLKWNITIEVPLEGGNTIEDQCRGQHTVVGVIEDGSQQCAASIVQEGDAV